MLILFEIEECWSLGGFESVGLLCCVVEAVGADDDDDDDDDDERARQTTRGFLGTLYPLRHEPAMRGLYRFFIDTQLFANISTVMSLMRRRPHPQWWMT